MPACDQNISQIYRACQFHRFEYIVGLFLHLIERFHNESWLIVKLHIIQDWKSRMEEIMSESTSDEECVNGVRDLGVRMR